MQRISVEAEFTLGELSLPVVRLDLLEALEATLAAFGGLDIEVEITDIQEV